MDSFPKVEDFKSDARGDAAVKWRDLPLGVFKLLSKRPTRNKYGAGMLLELEDADGVVYRTWAPTRLVDSLNNNKAIDFILNEGLKQVVSDPSKRYFAFSCIARG